MRTIGRTGRMMVGVKVEGGKRGEVTRFFSLFSTDCIILFDFAVELYLPSRFRLAIASLGRQYFIHSVGVRKGILCIR
jgi:hypothetical protein